MPPEPGHRETKTFRNFSQTEDAIDQLLVDFPDFRMPTCITLPRHEKNGPLGSGTAPALIDLDGRRIASYASNGFFGIGLGHGRELFSKLGVVAPDVLELVWHRDPAGVGIDIRP